MQELQRQTTQVTTQRTAAPAVENPQRNYTKKKAIFRIYQVIWYVLGVMEVLLIARFILRALSANAATGFVSFIYTLSSPLVAPFRGIFPTPQVQGSVFEWYTLIACIVYLLLAYGLVQLFQLVKPTDPTEVDQQVNQ